MEKTPPEISTPLCVPAVKKALLALGGLTAANGVYLLTDYHSLPESIPVHFDAGGVPDAFAAPSIGAWFMPFFVSIGFGAMMFLVCMSIFKIPESMLSVPKKKQFLSLAPQIKKLLLAKLAFHTLILGITLSAMMFAVSVAMSMLARNSIERFPLWIILAALSLVLIEVVLMTVIFSAAVSGAASRSLDADLPIWVLLLWIPTRSAMPSSPLEERRMYQ